MTAIIGSFVFASLILWFQNCSQVNFGPAGVGPTSAASSSPAPDSDKSSYAWVSGGWSGCSASCGGGTQTQTVVCQRNDGATVADQFCAGTKPPASQVCNITACEVDHWVTSGFGACSASCGGGTQTQTVSCQNQNNAVVDASRCASPAPQTSQACNTQPCVAYSWVASGWSGCSQTCGGGTQNQSVACKDNFGNTVADAFCNSASKPATTQTCNAQTCLTYNWTQTGFGSCSATCGGGTQTQTVACKDNFGNQVADSLCAGAKPPVAQACNQQACVTYHWQQGGWGICSATCGGGVQYQAVTCVNSLGQTVDNSLCAGQPAPASAQACNAQACPTYKCNLNQPNRYYFPNTGLSPGHTASLSSADACANWCASQNATLCEYYWVSNVYICSAFSAAEYADSFVEDFVGIEASGFCGWQ